MDLVLSDWAGRIAASFVTARRGAKALAEYPGRQPATLAEGYAVQDAALALDGRSVAGWKVGRINAPHDGTLGANRLAGPIFADGVVNTGKADSPEMPIFTDGFAAAEAEMLLHVAPGWNGQLPTDDAATIALVDEVRLGIEIASSPYPGINADGPCVTVSDFGNNMGSVIGTPIVGWQDIDLCAITVRTLIDGNLVGEATAATMLDGPYGAVRFLLGNLAARGIDASGGLWISTGAITGVHEVRPGQSVVAEFVGHGAVRCTLARATPREK